MSLALPLDLPLLCMWLQVINKVKFIHQGEGHIKVKEKMSTSLQSLCNPYSLQAGALHSTEMHPCYVFKPISSQILIHLYVNIPSSSVTWLSVA